MSVGVNDVERLLPSGCGASCSLSRLMLLLCLRPGWGLRRPILLGRLRSAATLLLLARIGPLRVAALRHHHVLIALVIVGLVPVGVALLLLLYIAWLRSCGHTIVA